MSQIYACIYCTHANPLRKKDGKIRCERFSEWHNPIETVKCEGFFDKGAPSDDAAFRLEARGPIDGILKPMFDPIIEMIHEKEKDHEIL